MYSVKRSKYEEDYVLQNVNENMLSVFLDDDYVTLSVTYNSNNLFYERTKEKIQSPKRIKQWLDEHGNKELYVAFLNPESPKKMITSKDEALTLINSGEWDGDCSYFDEMLFKNIEFCKVIIGSSKWNGSIEFLYNTTYIRELYSLYLSRGWDGKIPSDFKFISKYNYNFYESVLSSDLWNGSIENFPEDLIDREICISLTTKTTWDGSVEFFDESLLYDEDFFKEIIKNNLWDGDASSFCQSITDNQEYARLLILSPYWNGSLMFICEKQDIQFYRDVINNPKWDGSIPFGDVIDNNFRKEVTQSPFWDGSLNNFNDSLLNDLEFAKSIIKNPKWNGSISFFGDDVKSDYDFALSVIESINFNFDFMYIINKEIEFFFSNDIMNDENFCLKIISSNKWKGDVVFGDEILKSESFVRLVINNDKWNGKCDRFGDNILKSEKMVEEITKSSTWNKDWRYFKVSPYVL